MFDPDDTEEQDPYANEEPDVHNAIQTQQSRTVASAVVAAVKPAEPQPAPNQRS